MDDGCTMPGSKGSSRTRPASISVMMSRSDSSTASTYRHGRMGDMTFHRFVALGDSFTEGVGDPDPARPNGLRGWADRVAEVLADRAGEEFGYANLAIRGRKLHAIIEEQLDAAVAL